MKEINQFDAMMEMFKSAPNTMNRVQEVENAKGLFIIISDEFTAYRFSRDGERFIELVDADWVLE